MSKKERHPEFTPKDRPAIPGRVGAAKRRKELEPIQLGPREPWDTKRARELYEWWPQRPYMNEALARVVANEWEARKSEAYFDGKNIVVNVSEDCALHPKNVAPGHPRARFISKEQYESAKELLGLLPDEPTTSREPIEANRAQPRTENSSPNPDGRRTNPAIAVAKNLAVGFFFDEYEIKLEDEATTEQQITPERMAAAADYAVPMANSMGLEGRRATADTIRRHLRMLRELIAKGDRKGAKERIRKAREIANESRKPR